MSEIKRAIEYIDDLLDAIKKDGLAVRGILPWEYKAVKMAQDSLRAELDREKNPLTWNERINRMTLEERAYWSPSYAYIQERSRKWAVKKFKHEPWKQSDKMAEYMRKFLASPYTEGANQ